MRKLSIFLVAALSLSACNQKPAQVVYKGHLYFTKNSFAANKTESKKALIFASPAAERDIEEPAKPMEIASSNNQITIAKGDNLYSLAKQYKTSTRDLIEANNLQPPYTIYPGKKLVIPTKRTTHVVMRGENLTKIARSYNVSLHDLAAINNVSKEYKVKAGEILSLPYSSQTASKTIASSSAPTTQKITPKEINKDFAFSWPVKYGRIIRNFGSKSDGTHNDGVNISAPFGTSIQAAGPGKVVYVGNELRGYGNLIIIKHPNGWLTAYAHNNEIFVAKNQAVEQGETIASIGSTGNVEHPQLHFGLRKGRVAVDPTKHIKSVLASAPPANSSPKPLAPKTKIGNPASKSSAPIPLKLGNTPIDEEQ